MEEYESPEASKIYKILWLNGGIIRDNKIKYVWKILWVTYQISSALIIVLSCTNFIFHTNETNIHHVVLTSIPMITLFNNISMNYYAMINFNKFIKFLKEIQHNNRTHSKRKYIKYVIPFLTSMIIVIPIASCALNSIDLIRSENPNFQDSTRYFYPPLSVTKINSISHYIIISLLQLLTLVPGIFSFISMLIAIYFLTQLLKNKFDKLRENIAISSKFTERQLESSHYIELNIKRRTNGYAAWRRIAEKIKRKNASIRFTREMNQYAKQFNILAQYTFFLKKHFQPIFSFYIAYCFGILIFMGHVLLTRLKHPNLYEDRIETDITSFCAILYILYKFGGVGFQLQEMMERTSKEIYSTPWYMLAPEYRKNIHLFLCITQKKTTTMAFKLLPVDYSMVPSFLNTAYSYILVLQTLLERQ